MEFAFIEIMNTLTLDEAFEKASKRIGRNIPPVSHYPIIYGDDAPNHVHVAQIITRGIPPDVAEVNASLICHCFNHFQEVVEALESAQELLMHQDVRWKICDGGRGNMGECSWWNRVAKQIREAKAKASQVTIP